MNIQRSIYWLVFIFLSVFLATTLSYSRVRVVEMNDNKMETITLSMGHSTILHFIDRPKKAVNGNSNYFSIKFTGNDVTIQLCLNFRAIYSSTVASIALVLF